MVNGKMGQKKLPDMNNWVTREWKLMSSRASGTCEYITKDLTFIILEL